MVVVFVVVFVGGGTTVPDWTRDRRDLSRSDLLLLPAAWWAAAAYGATLNLEAFVLLLSVGAFRGSSGFSPRAAVRDSVLRHRLLTLARCCSNTRTSWPARTWDMGLSPAWSGTSLCRLSHRSAFSSAVLSSNSCSVSKDSTTGTNSVH